MSSFQLHTRLSDEEVRNILQRYDQGQLDRKAAQAQLGVKKSRFFYLLRAFRDAPEDFSITYERTSPKRLSPSAEKAIKEELLKDKKLIENKDLPIKYYNYSFLREMLKREHDIQVSLPTIINRAKLYDCYKERKRTKAIHDREVLTNYVGELVQHDTSIHLWSPYAEQKWYLITSLDDYSRRLLFAELYEIETSYKHIYALEQVCLSYGVPQRYYVDQHAIFRYVKDRDKMSPATEGKTFTDDVDPQWKAVCKRVGIQPVYALSAQAKGKIERPYRWLQDHLVRRCAKEKVKTIDDARTILQDEVHQYNSVRVHSTTKEIPALRFEQAVQKGRTLMRSFCVPTPYKEYKDIFCLQAERVPDAYRNISLFGATFKVSGALPRHKMQIHMYPDLQKQTVELRCWFKDELKDIQTAKMSDLRGVQF